jgi:hypothetical protein
MGSVYVQSQKTQKDTSLRCRTTAARSRVMAIRPVHTPWAWAEFDAPDLVSHAGLVPVMARAGLGDLDAEHFMLGGEYGVNARLKVPALDLQCRSRGRSSTKAAHLQKLAWP